MKHVIISAVCLLAGFIAGFNIGEHHALQEIFKEHVQFIEPAIMSPHKDMTRI